MSYHYAAPFHIHKIIYPIKLPQSARGVRTALPEDPYIFQDIERSQYCISSTDTEIHKLIMLIADLEFYKKKS